MSSDNNARVSGPLPSEASPTTLRVSRLAGLRAGTERRLRRFAICGLIWLASVCVCRAAEPQRVEAAIQAGLRWLAANQIQDGTRAGSWESARYPGAVTSLAGLAFLANGHLPGEEGYGPAVSRAMAYVRALMTPEGYLGQQGDSMYVHAMCTLFGLSYLGMSGGMEDDRQLADWCRRSLALIESAQDAPKGPRERGGWRYSPFARESDASVTAWQLLALHAARQCGYDFAPGVMEAALRYLRGGFMEEEGGVAGYAYRPGVSKGPEPGVSGAVLFIRSLLEPEPDAEMGRAAAWLSGFPFAWGGSAYNGYFYFVSFYLSQGMFQLGESTWEQFKPRMEDVLVEHQEGDGRWPFPPDNKTQSRLAGPAYPTAMAVLMLSLDKQYLPMYQRQKALF